MIVKDYLPDNHAPTTFHRVKQVTLHPPFTMATVEVVSYASEDSYLAGASHLWANRLQIPMVNITGPINDHIENWLIDPASAQLDGGLSPFGDGIIVGDRMETLENAKERVWTRIKYMRQRKLAEPFLCDGNVFDADVQNVTGSATKAFISVSQGIPYAETYTLADNSVVELDGPQMIAVGLALGDRNSAVYQTARELRELILGVEVSDGMTEQQAIAYVAGINWPQ